MIDKILKEACWIKKARLSYYKKVDNSIILSTSEHWMAYHITPIANERWRVIVFNTKANATKLVLANPEIYRKKIDEYEKDEERYKHRVNFALKLRMKYLARELDGLDPIWSKVFIKGEEVISNDKLFDVIVTKEQFNLDKFKELFGFVSESSERLIHIKHDNWDIWFDSNTGKDTLEFTNLLDDVTKAMTEKGLRKLCYGKVVAVPSIKGRALADYSEDTDILRIGFKETKKNSAMTSVIKIAHELAHRYWFKFTDRNFKQMVKDKFDSVRFKSPDYSVGDLVTSVKGSVLMVVKKDYKYYNLEVKEKSEKESEKIKEGQVYRIPEEIMGIAYIGKEDKLTERNAFIPREYGLANVEEFFAVLSEAFIGNYIQEPAKSWLEGIMK